MKALKIRGVEVSTNGSMTSKGSSKESELTNPNLHGKNIREAVE